MKVALLADIHANSDALRAVLAAAEAAGADRLIVAGDMIGYYYDAGPVMALLAAWPDTLMVRGNHEDMLSVHRQAWAAGRAPLTHPIPGKPLRHAPALAAACEQLTPAELDALDALPATLRAEVGGRSVFVCHGAPDDTNQYVYPTAAPDRFEPFFATGCALIVHGHTHYPNVIERDGQILVNPGSVGQPRDRVPGACWALWDTTIHTVSLRRESYDVSRVVAEVAARQPDDDFLAEVLTRTRATEAGEA